MKPLQDGETPLGTVKVERQCSLKQYTDDAVSCAFLRWAFLFVLRVATPPSFWLSPHSYNKEFQAEIATICIQESWQKVVRTNE